MKIHSTRSLALALAAAASLFPFTACVIDDKTDPDKGLVDDSAPSGDPTDGDGIGKADSASKIVTYRIESAHPYANNLDKTYALDLAAALPTCANRVKLHFATLRTEAGYDFVTTVAGDGTEVQSFDGTRDNLWTDWVGLSDSKRMSIRLETDYSVVRDGFIVDAVEWDGHVMCPAPPDYDCGDGALDLRRPVPACGCPEISHCSPLDGIEISHTVGGGFSGQVTGKRAVGLDAYSVVSMPATDEQVTHVGTLDRTAFRQLATELATSGVLYGPGRSDPSNWTECFSVTTDQETVSYCAPAGAHSAQVTDFIARFEALMTCPGSLSCDASLTCQDGFCADSGCICTEQYDPVCAVGGQTYSNACRAGCAGASVAHQGECGIAGDTCGTLMGFGCLEGHKCRYGAGQFEAPYPDAGGACVVETYCDAPPDCNGLPHIAVPGSWSCASNQCAWQTGPAWTAVAGFRFESTHPYGNNVSTWKQLYLPAGAARMRLRAQGTFKLEQGYDFLEVWTWQQGAWRKIKRYTGTTAPTTADTFAGQYHYLKFVSDSSVTAHGFDVTAESSNL